MLYAKGVDQEPVVRASRRQGVSFKSRPQGVARPSAPGASEPLSEVRIVPFFVNCDLDGE